MDMEMTVDMDIVGGSSAVDMEVESDSATVDMEVKSYVEHDTGKAGAAVLFTPQNLTEDQQKQARKNIGITGNGINLGQEHAGELLIVGMDGQITAVKIGAGLKVVNGVLMLDGTVTPDTPGDAVIFSVDADGNATLTGATVTVDSNGNTTLTGATLTVDEEGNAMVA